jgi:hypothetical protein
VALAAHTLWFAAWQTVVPRVATASEGATMGVASFLNEISDILAERNTSSRELAAIEFEADGRDVSLIVRREAHASWYPPLGCILGMIGRTCHEQGVAVPQLRRITLLDNEVRVELVDTDGQPGKVYRYALEVTLGAPAPEPAALQTRAA